MPGIAARIYVPQCTALVTQHTCCVTIVFRKRCDVCVPLRDSTLNGMVVIYLLLMWNDGRGIYGTSVCSTYDGKSLGPHHTYHKVRAHACKHMRTFKRLHSPMRV